MLPRDLVRRIRRIEIQTRRAVNQGLAGHYHSVFKGRGMAFSEVRQYQPGDEIRTIDWNVTARARDPYVKVFVEERELTVMLIVDLSASGDFGSTEKAKAEVAAEVAALLAFSAVRNNDRVGLILFTDRVERTIPPKKGRSHVLRVISEILGHRPEGRGTDLAGALDTYQHLQRRSAVTFVVSDFLADERYHKPLRIAGRRHDLIPVVLWDPWEEQVPELGLILGEDAETGAPIVLDTRSAAVRRALERRARERRATLARDFSRMDLEPIWIRTDRDYVAPLVGFFRKRARRRAR
jgi:uncharacterized protein (DUF58 family)